MSENYNDKTIQQKLQSLYEPYDPKGWENMEALLNADKRKRRFIPFWWKMGIAAGVIALVAFILWINKPSMNTTTKGTAIHLGISNTVTANATLTTVEKRMTTEKTIAKEGINKAAESPVQSFSSSFSKKVKNKTVQMNSPSLLTEKTTTEANRINTRFDALPMLAAFLQNELPNNIQENLIETNSSTTIKKKRLIHHNLYIDSYLGEAFANQTPATKPTGSVGIGYELLIAKRFGITTGFRYTQTAFKVNNPKTEILQYAPKNYTSSIAEVEIPIGVKCYPIVTPKVSFYINTGISNHIKLKETFQYDVSNIDTTTPNTSIASNNVYSAVQNGSYFPKQTSFSANSYESADVTNVFPNKSSFKGKNTHDFAIAQGNRYYLSYYFSTGVEVRMTKHLFLNIEPSFSIALSKIGVQNKRKYDTGLRIAFDYRF